MKRPLTGSARVRCHVPAPTAPDVAIRDQITELEMAGTLTRIYMEFAPYKTAFDLLNNYKRAARGNRDVPEAWLWFLFE